MKIVTWNVNSIRARILSLTEFLIQEVPDIVLLQEIKCQDEYFPRLEIENLLYDCYINGEKRYNGVAILSKLPVERISYCFSNALGVLKESRFLEITVQTSIGSCDIISLYAPNGHSKESDKFIMKLNFYDELIEYLLSKTGINNHVIIGGDFNIAPFDLDVYSPNELDNTICCSLEERFLFRRILNSGFIDLYRLLNKNVIDFSWWDYRGNSFKQNKGMRIDMMLSSYSIANHLVSCFMDKRWRASLKPSDHIPVLANFSI